MGIGFKLFFSRAELSTIRDLVGKEELRLCNAPSHLIPEEEVQELRTIIFKIYKYL
tara:strand:- start:901 stop:1068 length:168 start_codon:yes stop_codon:yes gene_type:complete